jgi:hypothetical protein
MRKPYLGAALITAVIFFSIVSGNAQTSLHDIVINGGPSSGYGYPNPLRKINGGIPALNMSTDYSLNDFFSFGLYVAYTYVFYKFHDQLMPEVDYKNVWKGWDMGVRSSFHFSSLITENEKTDLYITGFFGYTMQSFVYDKRNIHSNYSDFDIHDVNAGSLAGFRYYLTKTIGIYAEAGLSREFFMSAGACINLTSAK